MYYGRIDVINSRSNNDIVYLFVQCSRLPGKFFCSSIISKSRYNYHENTIYSYRLERTMPINTTQNKDAMNEFIIYKKIIYVVDIHRQAMNIVFIQ